MFKQLVESVKDFFVILHVWLSCCCFIGQLVIHSHVLCRIPTLPPVSCLPSLWRRKSGRRPGLSKIVAQRSPVMASLLPSAQEKAPHLFQRSHPREKSAAKVCNLEKLMEQLSEQLASFRYCKTSIWPRLYVCWYSTLCPRSRLSHLPTLHSSHWTFCQVHPDF